MRTINILIFSCLYSIALAQKIDIQPYLRDAVKVYGIPSVAMAIVSSKETIAMGAYGIRRTDKRSDSVSIDDRYHLGSNTKTFTAFWAALLVERGLINWETPLLEIFPDWEKLIHKDYKKIKLIDFLTHRSGVRPYMKSEEFIGVPRMRDTFGVSEHRIAFAKYALKQKPLYVYPGRYEYSNANYAIAAAILEKVSGMTWEEAMKKEIAERLGIRIEFGWPYYLGEDQPLGHFDEKNLFMVHVPQLGYGLSDYIAPAGDINVSIRDYAVFVQEYLRGLKEVEGVYLSKATYERMLFGYPGYSIGWVSWNYRPLSSHDGYAGSFYAHVAIFRDLDIAVVILMNTGARKHINGLYDLRKKIMALVEANLKKAKAEEAAKEKEKETKE